MLLCHATIYLYGFLYAVLSVIQLLGPECPRVRKCYSYIHTREEYRQEYIQHFFFVFCFCYHPADW